MKEYSAVAGLVVLLLLSLTIISFAQEAIWEDIGRGILNAKTILVNNENPQIVYLGTNNGVFKTGDAGQTWRNILSVRGQNKAVNFLLADPQNKNTLYAASGSGLFYSSDQGRSWKKIFKGKNSLASQCTALTVLSSCIYLGTKAGLYSSKDHGRSWTKESAKLANSQILAIASHPQEPDYLYVACSEGVFKTKDAGGTWERIFVASATEKNDDDGQEETEDQDESGKISQLRYISIDPNNPDYLYLATSRGVYQSRDKGEAWELLSDYGLLSKDVRLILVSGQSEIYVATQSSAFVYRGNQWQELTLRLFSEEINFLACDTKNHLYLACAQGLFKANPSQLASNTGSDILSIYSQNEPEIARLQQAAVKYAEVEPEKIMRWRKQARMKAFLPKLTIGLDRSESTNYEIYTSATTKYVYEGPYDRSCGWDVTLSWELGDFVFSDDQTNIDVRSRLMVQLRDDILDEVTKLYFERIRVKMELDNLSLEERKKRFEKELRLHELTASLDALTGGYFSQQLKPRDSS